MIPHPDDDLPALLDSVDVVEAIRRHIRQHRHIAALQRGEGRYDMASQHHYASQALMMLERELTGVKEPWRLKGLV